MSNSGTPSEIKFCFRPLRVFLCHASEDKNKVRALRALLSELTWVKTWLDEENIVPGVEWEPAIALSLQQSDVVIVCLSKHSISKEGYVQKEIRYALNVADEKPEGTIFLIPLRLDSCAVPQRLRRWQWVDMFGDERRGYGKLVTALQARANTVWALRDLSTPTTDPRGVVSKSSRSSHEMRSRNIRPDRKIIRGRTTKPQLLLTALAAISLFPSLWYWQELIRFNPIFGPMLPLLLFLYICQAMSYWLLKTPVLVIRHQHVDELDLFAEYVINFSIANRRGKPLIINLVTFRIGDYEGEGPPPFMFVILNKFERELQLEFVGHPDNMPFPVINQERSDSSMGNATYALLQERGLLGPYEQIDFWLVINLRRSPQLKSKYPTVWKLGGRIQVNYEGRFFNDQLITYP